MPGVISGITMVFMPAITTFVIPNLLGSGKVNLIGNLIEQQFVQSYNWYFGASLSLVLMVFILISMSILNALDPSEGEAYEDIKKTLFGFDFLIFIRPHCDLDCFSFNDSKSRAVWGGFTLKWYQNMVNDPVIMKSLYYTIVIALSAAIISTLIGTFAAIGIHYMKRWFKKVVINVTYLPVLNPDIVTGIGLMLLFILINLKLGFQSLLIAHINFCIPYVIISVLPKLKQLSPNTFEAALDLGATPFQTLFKVIVPEISPGIITGFYWPLPFL